MPFAILQYVLGFSTLEPRDMFNGHDRVRALARGLATGLSFEASALAAGFSHATALAVASSDAFKNLLAHEEASTRVSDILSTTAPTLIQ